MPKRQSYTIKQKLEIINKYEKGVAGKGLPAISKETGISRDTLRGWVRKKRELEDTLTDSSVQTKRTHRLKGGGRKAKLGDLEDELHNWILDKNAKGLRVKDQHIQLKALNIYSKNREEYDDAEANDEKFLASSGWLAKFKTRKRLVSQQQTTCRSLPEVADVCEDAPDYYLPEDTKGGLFKCLAKKLQHQLESL